LIEKSTDCEELSDGKCFSGTLKDENGTADVGIPKSEKRLTRLQT
jgi:hypothetical protein